MHDAIQEIWERLATAADNGWERRFYKAAQRLLEAHNVSDWMKLDDTVYVKYERLQRQLYLNLQAKHGTRRYPD